MDTQEKYRASAAAYQHRIYGFARYLLRSREDAEDVTQEVLLKLWRQYPAIRPGTMDAWVIRVTRNACLDLLRSRGARENALGLVALEDAEDAADGNGRSALERNELRAQVRDCINSLDEPYRSVLVLREIQELAYHEIADALALPLNTTKTYLHRGRRMLREKLRGKVALL